MSEGSIRVITQNSVTLLVTNSLNKCYSEQRLQKAMKIADLKGRLELVTGISSSAIKLELYDKCDGLVAHLNDDDALLGSYPADDGMRLHVIGKGVSVDEFGDMSKVEKQTLSEEDYSKRNDSVRAYLMRNKLGKYANPDAVGESSKSDNNDEDKEEALAKEISVGDRCEVVLPGHPTKRGEVKFIGKTQFQSGIWVGVQYDEPLGKNDGSVDGKVYFKCPAKYGAFVKPQVVTIGDFPEEDLELDDEM